MYLKELRQKKGISQQKLANFLNVSRSAIAMWETGKSSPDLATLVKIANYFGVSVDFLLENEKPIIHEPEPWDHPLDFVPYEEIQFAFLNGFDDLPDDEKKKRFVEIVGRLSEMMKNEPD